MTRSLVLTWSFVAVTAVAGASACGGPSQQQLAETPSATTRARQVEAPPASTSDRDRERAVQQFDDMETTQNAHREAASANQGAGQGSGAAKPTKKGPAEQATLPKKKTGPAEQGTLPPEPK